MSTFAIDGIIPVISTPFTADDRVDWRRCIICRILQRRAACGAVCLPAYASQFHKLTDAERSAIARLAMAILDGILPVVTQVNHVSSGYVAQIRAGGQPEASNSEGISMKQ